MGTNTLVTYAGGETISDSTVNQYKSALIDDQVPRDSNGAPVDNASKSGTGTYRFSEVHTAVLAVGTNASSNSMTEDSSANPVIKRNGSIVATFDANGITKGSLQPLGQQISSSCGSFSTTSTSLVDVTNLSVTITTTGRSVFVGLIPNGDGNQSSFDITATTTAADIYANYELVRDTTTIASTRLRQQVGAAAVTMTSTTPACLTIIDPVSAGTYTYKVQMNCLSGTTGSLTYSKLVAYEL